MYSDDQMMRDIMRIKGEDVAERPDIFHPYERTETMAHYWRLEEQRNPNWEAMHDDDDQDEYEWFNEDADRDDADDEAYAASL